MEIKTCPFCGFEPTFEQIGREAIGDELRWTIGCRQEECIGYQSLTTYARKGDALMAWNTRQGTDNG